MSWWSRWLRKRRAEKKADPPAAAERRPRPVPLFRSEEGASSPVDLTSELEVGGASLGTELEHLREGRSSEEAAILMRLEAALTSEVLVLPPMPETVLRVQREIDDPDCNIRKLSAEIEHDPALATKMVGIANSPFYGGLGRIATIHDAVVRVGLSEVRNIALALTLRSRVFRVPGFEHDIADLWAHSLASSIATREVAALTGSDPEAAFFLGLIHDLGRVAVITSAAHALRGEASAQRKLIREVEGRVHAVLGEALAHSWNLSPELGLAIRFHHAPHEAPDTVRPHAALLSVGDLLSHSVTSEQPPPVGAGAALDLDCETLLSLAEPLREEFLELSKRY